MKTVDHNDAGQEPVQRPDEPDVIRRVLIRIYLKRVMIRERAIFS
jgi:hypothetical protein